MSTRELLILTGMSGAGRSTVAHALEDLGWYVVDNLPPALLPDLASQTSGSEFQSVAIVVDVRGGEEHDPDDDGLEHGGRTGRRLSGEIDRGQPSGPRHQPPLARQAGQFGG